MATADVFVTPTRQEAFDMVFQEAAAAGIPSARRASLPFPRSWPMGRQAFLSRLTAVIEGMRNKTLRRLSLAAQ
jgi:hypothetical protein